MVLIVFVSFNMGPSAIIAWGILTLIWDVMCHFVEAISNAGKIRILHHLQGNGEPNEESLSYILAKQVAYKSLSLVLIMSIFIASILLVIGEPILPFLIPNDATLQDMIYLCLPLVGIGYVSYAIRMSCSMVLITQGRYQIAQLAMFISILFVTIPLSLVTILVLKWNLLGPVASLVVGYTLSGAILMGYVISSDWKALSEKMMLEDQYEEVGSCGNEKNNNMDDNNKSEEKEEEVKVQNEDTASSIGDGENLIIPQLPTQPEHIAAYRSTVIADDSKSSPNTILKRIYASPDTMWF